MGASVTVNAVVQSQADNAAAAEKAKRTADVAAAVKAKAYQDKLDLISAKEYISKLEAAQVEYNNTYTAVQEYITSLEGLATYRADTSNSTGTITDNGLATVVYTIKANGVGPTTYTTNDVYVETTTDSGLLYRHILPTVVNATVTVDGTVTIALPISAGDIKLTLYHKKVVDTDTVQVLKIGVVHLI